MSNYLFKNRVLVLLLLGVVFNFSITHAQKFWNEAQENKMSLGEKIFQPNKYLFFEMTEGDIRPYLNNLNGTQLIELPNPDGENIIFQIKETPIFLPGTQKRFPSIRTFTATSVESPWISAKIDITEFGFHAMIFDPIQTWIIEPYNNNTKNFYISFYKNDHPVIENNFICLLDDENRNEIIDEEEILINQNRPSSNIKRTYRLALSCTGEYANAVAGPTPTKSNVLSAMTTIMNRVNGVYERELSVTMVFIEDIDSIIYLDPNTDPFTANNNGGVLLGQNHRNLKNVIGLDNFDIGHVFSTGGGGIANLASVCSDNTKGMGVTGSTRPVGDPFAVDYVCHEIGHQFAANHTFNNCGGNENWRTAYEPGGGSTILSYAGICGASNNLQLNSDDYFHTISLLNILTFLNSGFNNCETTESNNIIIPNLENVHNVYNIPASTPFELAMPKSTNANPKGTMYSWEQWDLGNLQQPETNGASFRSGPSFRSYKPKINDSTRIFPTERFLLQKDFNRIGERISLYSRNMHFKLTSRYVENGWGAFRVSYDSLRVQVTQTNKAFDVLTPNTPNTTFKINSTIDIKWEVGETDKAPINCSHVDIYFSTDNGYTFPLLIAEKVPNTGKASIKVPDTYTDKGRFKVKGHDNIFFNISTYNFKIGDTALSIDNNKKLASLKISPNPAEDFVFIQNNEDSKLNIRIYNQLGQTLWQGNSKEKTIKIDVSSFARGLYLIHIFDENGMGHNKKIILQ